jgi:hypothetical protein
MAEETGELIPFHALNEFMRPDYRQHVVRVALSARPTLPDELRQPLDQLIKKHVKVPGFRSSDKAPARVKTAPTAEAFEDHPDLVAAVLGAWAEAQSELRQQIYNLLSGRGWQLLPVEARRVKMPGFFIRWPKSEDFETLRLAFQEAYPHSSAGPDDISLMVVWVGMRLPYQIIDEPPDQVTHITDRPLEMGGEA